MGIITITDSCLNYRRTIEVDAVTTQDNWVFLHSGCLVIRTRLGRDYWVPDSTLLHAKDTIYWPPGDTVITPARYRYFNRFINVPDSLEFDATACAPCVKTTYVDQWCFDTTKITVTRTDTTTVCDTACTALVTVAVDSVMYWLRSWDFESLAFYAGDSLCISPCHTGAVMLWEDPSGLGWIFNGRCLDPTYPHRSPPPGASTCCIPITILRAWLSMNPQVVPTTFTKYEEQRRSVGCSGTWMKGFERTITNCRDVIRTTDSWTWRIDTARTGVLVPVADDTCDCYAPYYVCTPEHARDSIWTRNVYTIVSTPITRDTCVPCTKDYVVPAAWHTVLTPEYGNEDTCLTWAELATLLVGQPLGRIRDVARPQVAILHSFIVDGRKYTYEHGCFRPCAMQTDTTALGIDEEYWWIDLATMQAAFPCLPATCAVVVDRYDTLTGSCRPVTTGIVGICRWTDEGGASHQIWTPLFYEIPGADSTLCTHDTVGWSHHETLVRVDTLHFTILDPPGYELRWRDTCRTCEPTIQVPDGSRRTLCPELKIRNDCPTGTQPYFDGQTLVLNYSCSDGGGIDPRVADLERTMEAMASSIAWLQYASIRTQDSLLALQDSIAALRADLDAIVVPGAPETPFWGTAELDGSGLYRYGVSSEPGAVLVTYKNGGTAMPYWEYSGGDVVIHGDPGALVSFEIVPMSLLPH